MMKTLKLMIGLLIACSASAFAGDLTPARRKHSVTCMPTYKRQSMILQLIPQTIVCASVVMVCFIGLHSMRILQFFTHFIARLSKLVTTKLPTSVNRLLSLQMR